MKIKVRTEINGKVVSEKWERISLKEWNKIALRERDFVWWLLIGTITVTIIVSLTKIF